MPNPRTPSFVVELRFYVLTTLVGCPFFVIFGEHFLTVATMYYMAMIVLWHLMRIVTNIAIRAVTPDTFRALRLAGVDPMTNSMGWPLNPDSEFVRQYGLVPNTFCVSCCNHVFVEPGYNECPYCHSTCG